MSVTSRRLGGLGVAVVAIAVLAACGGPGSRGPDPSALEDFRAEDLQGRVWDMERLEGQVVLLDFWATWCGPCVQELPYLKTAYQRHDEDGFEILGISLDGPDRDAFRAWLRENDVAWPQVHEGKQFDSRLAREFDVTSIPSSLLIDRDGAVIGRNLRGPQLVQAIEEAVEQRPSG